MKKTMHQYVELQGVRYRSCMSVHIILTAVLDLKIDYILKFTFTFIYAS